MDDQDPVSASRTAPAETPGFEFRLFGRFTARYAGEPIADLDRAKVQDVLCYLLLNRDRFHHREDLATVFWGDFTTSQSRKYLRQALWHLQKTVDQASGDDPHLLTVDPEWVHINADARVWVDVGILEQSFALVTSGAELYKTQAEQLAYAASLCTGKLLQGWYQDWCTFDRDRLEGIYLQILDRLMDRCEATRGFEEGIALGNAALRRDRARELTHRRMIRLFYLAGDRTSALHQYRRCATALEEDLGVAPSSKTAALYDLVRADRWETVMNSPEGMTASHPSADRLSQVHTALSDIQTRVADELRAIEQLIQT